MTSNDVTWPTKCAEIIEDEDTDTRGDEEKSRTRTSNIIMVDDEPDVNITIKTALQENGGFEVDTFNDAESALLGFKPGYYDLAILDIRMPGTNGFQLCRKLREIDK